MRSQLRIDFTALMEAGVGEPGITETELDDIAARAAASQQTISARVASGEVGFFDLPDDPTIAGELMEYARCLPPHIDTMVVLGIGGSSLGPHALYSALAHPFDQLRPRTEGMPRRLFFPDNPDPQTFRGLLDVCSLDRTLFAVITKSGGTAETAAQLLVVLEHLQQTLGVDRVAQHVVAVTDPEQGVLRRLVREKNLPSFSVPASVGGRFSVLSPVGLLPAAVAGLDVSGLLEGARCMRDRVCNEPDVRRNPALLLASLLYLHHSKRGRPMVVAMPYVDALFDTADWFRQLWAESLGKELSRTGERINVGPTPIASRGATDQHSQLQLYAEGPDDKVYLMVGVNERGPEVSIPASGLPGFPEYAYLAGRGLGELLDAELRGTTSSLTRRGRPNATFTLERVSAQALGELLMYLEATTAFAGPLYDVDPFDQPGVEEAKRLTYAALGREGYEELTAELDRAKGADERYLF